LITVRVLQILFFAAAAALLPLGAKAHAQGIEQLLIDKVPVPTPRPFVQKPVSPSAADLPIKTPPAPVIDAQNGTLKQGLAALDKGNVSRAMGIRAGMQPGSLDRKILAWAIALSGKPGIAPGTISKIGADLKSWPGAKQIRRNTERALARQGLSPKAVVAAFRGGRPLTVEGAILLAKAHLDLGQKQKANRAISDIWRYEKLDKKSEKRVLQTVGPALTRKDHRVRMHKLLYRDRATAATRIAGKAEQVSLAKARAAVLRKSDKSASLIKAVAPSSKKDTGFLFARIEHARRTGNYNKAADLLLNAPLDPDLLIDPHEWWVERRIVSREMLEIGKYRKAYRLVARHAAQSNSDIAEAEFHAGWYALRFLKDKTTARKHFEKILLVSKRPISQARGYYWLARASSPAKARGLFRKAAKHGGTFYGQLAAAELGTRKLSIDRPRASTADKSRLRARELYRAIKRLEGLGHGWRAEPMYRHLARNLNSTGELAVLAADAERRGDYNLSLQVGKIAYGRGLEVDTLSWPIGAIPGSASISGSGRALAYAIARQESAFDKAAISGANARGLLQLLPGTAKSVAKRNGLKYSKSKLTRDAGYNATLGSAYLAEQLERFGNSYVLTFAAYNAGPGRVDEWLERFGDPRGKPLYQVIDWIEQIPFTETRHYVQRVMENYQVYKHRIKSTGLMIKSDLVRGRG